MKNYILLYLLIIVPFLLISQNTSTENTIETSYQKHFIHARETVSLHLNKSTFFTGEEIWWTAYIYNKKNGLPSNESSNLYCGIYNQDGKQVLKELFLVEDGIAHGSFKLGKEFKSGTYYIKAGTSWMKNFDEDNDYIQEITIINEPLPTSKKVVTTYDFQLLPEGGHFIENIDNIIGVRLINQNGEGVKSLKGQLFNNANQLVTEVHLNDYGIGKFNFFYNSIDTFLLKIVLEDGNILEKKLPAPKKMGVVLSINNILEDKLLVVIKTNEATLAKIKGDEFHLAAHRDGLMALKSFDLKETSQIISIPKTKLLSGTNIVTLFDKKLTPISERLIFNYKNLNITKLDIKTPIRKNKDSIAIKINAFSKNNIPMRLSISALPANSIARNFNSNIITNFLLKPYLKSSPENPAQFFENIDRKKEYGLDLVLLTQGWSSYNWDSIFMGSPEIKYPFENGIAVSGTITSKIRKGDELAINYGDVTNMQFVKLKDSTDFKINNLLNYNNDTLWLALRNKNKKLRKPEINTNFLSSLDLDEINFEIPNLHKTLHSINLGEALDENTTPSLFIEDNTIALKGVEVTEERIEKKLTRASPLINNAFFNEIKIGEEELRRNPTLTQLIIKNGFRVINTPRFAGIINVRPNAGPVRVYIDDFIAGPTDIQILIESPLRDIDEIYFTRNGLAGDVDASGGVIRVYRKQGAVSPINSSFAEKLVKNSFTRPKKFYRPDYISYDSQNFIEYGVVHWEPNISTNKNGEAILTIPDNGLQQIKLFVEGMGEDGALLSYSGHLNIN